MVNSYRSFSECAKNLGFRRGVFVVFGVTGCAVGGVEPLGSAATELLSKGG